MANLFKYAKREPVHVEVIGDTTVEVHFSPCRGYYAIDPSQPADPPVPRRPDAKLCLGRGHTRREALAQAAHKLGYRIVGTEPAEPQEG